MGFYPPGTPPSPHLYPQELQLKLYQAFIFSIPILFTIILVLLFYLFYLKRRASTLSSSQHFRPTTTTTTTTTTTASSSNQHPASSHFSAVGLKEKLSEKLQVVSFDEELRSKESQCCVCLGEFEMKEELLQIASCRHVFHMDCIRHWLLNNSTCPLCRCSVIPTITKLNGIPPATMMPLVRSEHQVVDIILQLEPLQQQQTEGHVAASSAEHHSIRIVEAHNNI